MLTFLCVDVLVQISEMLGSYLGINSLQRKWKVDDGRLDNRH